MEVFDAGGPAAAVVAMNLWSDHPTPDEHRTSVAQVNLDTTTEARGTVKDWEDLFQEVANGFTDLEVSSADPGSSIPSRYQIIDSHDLDISIQDQRNQQRNQRDGKNCILSREFLICKFYLVYTKHIITNKYKFPLV